ncbi:hypothetical protein GQ600_16542 [Phytophthora cactorum]|nr:hypothetical protein GQ600_16542 [Phytophthora cactorum]
MTTPACRPRVHGSHVIRLRDTITLDSKVDKFVALYAEQERSLRNQKIELMKMERSDTNNQFRVQIRLLQNQIRLQEQELQHTQNKITDGENLVNNVWKEVIAVKSPPKQSVVRDLTRTGEYSLPSKELISVLGRFEAHIGRLQKKHGIAVKARCCWLYHGNTDGGVETTYGNPDPTRLSSSKTFSRNEAKSARSTLGTDPRARNQAEKQQLEANDSKLSARKIWSVISSV